MNESFRDKKIHRRKVKICAIKLPPIVQKQNIKSEHTKLEPIDLRVIGSSIQRASVSHCPEKLPTMRRVVNKLHTVINTFDKTYCDNSMYESSDSDGCDD